MGTGSMKNISMKQTNKNVDDDGTGVKPKHFLLRGIRYKSRCDQIQQMWDRDRKIARDKFGRKRKSSGFIYLPG